MLRRYLGAAAAVAIAAAAPVTAQAQYHGGERYYEQVRHDRDGGYHGRGYDRGSRQYYRGDRGRQYGGRGHYRGSCRDKGTGGTILGAIAGGLLGKEIGNGRHDRGDGTTGAILGAGIGALTGRAIDRDC